MDRSRISDAAFPGNVINRFQPPTEIKASWIPVNPRPFKPDRRANQVAIAKIQRVNRRPAFRIRRREHPHLNFSLRPSPLAACLNPAAFEIKSQTAVSSDWVAGDNTFHLDVLL